MNNNYENKILDAIQTLVDNAVTKAGYDKTIKAVISKCVNESTGKYVVRYQDSSFYAYSNDLDSIYSGGTPVYVLVPGNDMSQTKTILGSVDKLGTEYITLSESNAAYQEVGTSVITPNGAIPGISSYKADGDSLVIYDRTSSNNLVNVDLEGIELYFQQSNYMEIGGTFTTRLPEEQKRKGNYGLVFDMDFYNGEEIVNKQYVLDINSMTGNPYSYNLGSEQNAIFEIDGANFYRLNSITLECKNFPKSATPYTNDIFVEDIVLKALTPLTRDELANNSLTFTTKQGIYFNENDSASATRLIETEVKINKKIIPNTGGLLRFYWFKEDSTIGITSADYLPFGGPGWRCLNQYNVIDETNNVRDYITDVDTLTVVKGENPAKENEYKCVVIYNNEIQVERNIIIYNTTSEYTITIESDQGNYFKYNEGNPTLTCSVNPAGTYTYIWTETNSANKTEVLSETSNSYSVQLGTIANFSKFTCSVFSNGNFLGKSNIVITNSWDPEDNSYAIIMENGDQIFKYNEKGIAPTNKSLEKPIVLKPLQFTIYDEFGHEVDDNKISATDVSWYVPKEDTMIKVTTTGITPIEEDGYLIYSGVKTLNFEIASVYNNKKMNNVIKLNVRYNDRVFNTTSELEFLKEGEIGSNGTDFVCRIVPNVAANAQVPNYPIYTYNTTTSTGAMNYQLAANNKWFKVQLYKDGVEIYDGVASGTSEENKAVTVAWSMLTNKYSSTVSDATSFSVNSSTGEFSYTNLSDTNLDRAANITKVTVTYDGATYYATMPIILVRISNASYKLDLENNTGFRYVMYTTDGLDPAYDSSNPFAIIAYNGTTDITNNDNITFTYSTLGQIYNGTAWINENNFIAKAHGVSNPLAKNEADYRPIEKFDGLSVNNAVKCIVKESSSEIARIYLPIHFYLNRFGNAALNGWDGNHIEINDNGGFILAPQIGAGKKESDNSYTGIFMGNVHEAGSSNEDVGLFGYNRGVRTIELNAEDGSAKFGKAGAGQIIISPDEVSAHSVLKSGNYVAPVLDEQGNIVTPGSGLEIDLTDPHITFGSGNFRVDKNGNVSAVGFATVSQLEEGSYNIPGIENWKTIYATDTVQFEVNSQYYPAANTNKNIICQCSYKDTIVNEYTATLVNGAGTPISNPSTINGITVQVTKNAGSNDTNINFSVNQSAKITNATNTFYIKFTHTTSDLSITKAFYVNLIILGQDGAKGETGPAGPAGKDGTSVTVKGSYDTLAQLIAAHPSGNTLGDGYVVGLNLYVYTNAGGGGGSQTSDWNDVGQFKGEDAKRCFIVASSEVFKSTDNGVTYIPASATITPYLQAVNFNSWAYDMNDGNGYRPLTGTLPTGVSINNNIITVTNNSEIFNATDTVLFKCTTDNNQVYDIITITRVKDGKNGTNGTSPYFSYLTNETQSFVYGTATTATTLLYGYQGTTEKTVQIKTINGVAVATTDKATGKTGMNFKVSSTSATNHPTITFTTTTALPQGAVERLAIVYRITGESTDRTIYFSYSTTTRGAQGPQGANAQLLTINPSSQIFKSTEGATGMFTPQYIYLYPTLQNVTYSKWQYSTDGTTWNNITSGQHSLTIGTYNSVANSLRIERTCDLYTNSITAVSFKCISNVATVYDTVTVVKIYDVTDIEVGGRNYVENTSDIWSGWIIPGTGTNKTYNFGEADLTKLNLYTGDSIAMQIEIESQGFTQITNFSAQGAVNGSWSGDNYFLNPWNEIFKITSINNLNTIQKYTKVYKMPQSSIDKINTVGGKIDLGIRVDGANEEAKYRYRILKLEKGNMPTDWSAAPEDIDNAIEVVQDTAEAAYSQAQSALVTYAVTDTSKSPEASAEWMSNLPSAPDKFIWQRIEYKFLDSTKDYATLPSCIYTPTRITNNLQYCLCSQENFAENKITNAWRSEPFAWDDSYYTSTGVGNITINRYQFIRNVYTDSNKEGAAATTYSIPILDRSWYMFGLKIASETVARSAIEHNINNNIITMNSQNGLTVSSSNNTYGIRLTSVGMQFLLNGNWTTVWNIDGTLNANLITVRDLRADNILSGTLTLDTTDNEGSFILNSSYGESSRIDENGIKITNVDGSSIHLKTATGEGISAKTSANVEYFNIDPDTKATTVNNAVVQNDLSFNTNVKITHITNGIAFIGM